MNSLTARILTGAVAISAVASTVHAQRISARSMTADVPLAPSETKFLRGMSDADVLGHLIVLDSVEVDVSKAAIRRSKSDAVTAFAKQTLADHGSAMNADKQIGKQTGIAPTMIVGELKKSHMGAQVDSVDIASDLTVDRHYIMSQVEMHQHAIAELQTLREVARNPAIRAHIDAQIPAMREHLAKAHEIAMSKGFEKKM
ncbi:MAG: hypothetical protein JWM95_1095 [Gemmatimonadetes bacterium]|nr:hypothetical protein [Gemmatimonadota bacterium]